MKTKIYFSVVVASVVIGSALAVFYMSSANGTAKSSLSLGAGKMSADQPKTTTTALPERTNNAWEMKPFHLKGLDGETHSLNEWKGKVIMLNFWASWCAPCQYEIKDFIKYQEEFAGKGLQIIGLGIDEERKLRNVSRTFGINYPVLIADPGGDAGILAQWGNDKQMVPYTVVIDRDGRIKYIHRGQLEDDAFKEFVLRLLKAGG